MNKLKQTKTHQNVGTNNLQKPAVENNILSGFVYEEGQQQT